LRIDAALVVAALLCVVATPTLSEPLESYLIPGIDIRSADLTPGGWCRYLVVDSADGLVDTSSVYVAVLGTEMVAGEEAFWLELENRPPGGDPERRDVTRVLISSSIKQLALGDSLYPYIRRLYIKKGTGPAEPADPRDLQRLTLTRPTSDQDWTRQPDVSLETPLGRLRCERSELDLEESREIPAGRVTVIQRKRDRFVVWSSEVVPVFGLVRCEIDRMRESRTVPEIAGIPQQGPRRSRVTTMILEHGSDATPIIPVDK
jgi:hypothetical protein